MVDTYSREELIHDKWLNMNKEITQTKISKTTNRTHIQNVGKYIDIVKNKWFSTIKDVIISKNGRGYIVITK